MNQQVLAQKKETVSELNDILKNSHSAIIVSYSGLSVDEINKLRHDLKEAGAKLSVRKNSLLKKAIDEDGLSSLDSALKGPTALVTAVEEGAGLKVLNDFYEDHSKKFAIKGGVIHCRDIKRAVWSAAYLGCVAVRGRLSSSGHRGSSGWDYMRHAAIEPCGVRAGALGGSLRGRLRAHDRLWGSGLLGVVWAF